MMTTSNYDETGRSSGAAWLYVPVILILFVGGALSVAAYSFAEPELTMVESVAAGFGGLAGLIIGLIGAAVGIIVGLIGALIGIVVAGGAVALTLFIVGSPIIAIILIFMLMRRGNNRGDACPDPAMHE